MRKSLIPGAIFGICTSLLAGCERADAPAYASPDKLGEYLYYIEYDDYIPEIAGSVFPPIRTSAPMCQNYPEMN